MGIHNRNRIVRWWLVKKARRQESSLHLLKHERLISLKNGGLLTKLNIGAGSDIKEGWVNLDIAPLPRIDVIHNLNKYPWPFEDEQFDEVLANDVLEHLDNFLAAMEELYRIVKPWGKVALQVPYWNSWSRNTDPTHKHNFTEDTFRFFDPQESLCQLRPYYSKARFHILKETLILTPLLPAVPIPMLSPLEVKNSLCKKILKILSGFFCNIIQDLRYVLIKTV